MTPRIHHYILFKVRQPMKLLDPQLFTFLDLKLVNNYP
jgi:hypothetical protein